MKTVNRIQEQLFALQDLEYQRFQCRLMPTVAPETVIGVRMPALRSYAKTLSGTPAAETFLNTLPHRYYEENNLHGLLIDQLGDFSRTVAAVDAFLPHVDNWATCDLLSPRVFAKHLPELLEKILGWLRADGVYTVRFAIGMLMRFYLEDAVFQPEYPELVASVRSEEYYIRMMAAWYFATALAKQPEAVLPYFSAGRLEPWTRKKAIQKAVESRRISPQMKEYLRTLR